MRTAKQVERFEKVRADIMRRREFEDRAVVVGERLRDLKAALKANEEQMKSLAREVEPGHITNVAKCLKVSRQTVHRWRKLPPQ